MRRRLEVVIARPRTSVILVVLAATSLAAGCGASEEPTTRAPTSATFTAPGQGEDPNSEPDPTCRPTPNEAASKRGRDVRVAGLDAEPRRRPRELAVAREVTLDCLVWSRFGRGSATATGRATVLNCIPSCAQSGTDRRAAELTVSGLRRCRGRRFYTKAELVVGDSGETLRAFVSSPCDSGEVGPA